MKNSSKLDELFTELKVHNKDIDACFNDAMAERFLKEQIKDLMLDIIGEDEPTDIMESELGRGGARNQLRAVQRAKVEDL